MRLRNFWEQLLRSGSVEGGGAPAPAPAADASAPATPAERMGVSEEIVNVFNFDPFEPSQEVETPPAVEGPEGVAGGVVSAPPPPVQAPPEVAPSAPAEPPLAQTVQELRDAIGALPEAIRQVPPTAPPQPQEDAWLPRDGEQALNYMQVMSTVPDQLVAAIGSENPTERKAAIGQLMGIGMTIAHRMAMKQAVEQVRREMSSILPQFVGEQIRNYDTAQQVYKDFYGKFPQLSAPQFRPIVQAEAAKLSRQLGVSGWTPEFRDRLGAHVLGMFGQVVPATVQPHAPATQTPGATARPAMANGSYNASQDMADLLGI